MTDPSSDEPTAPIPRPEPTLPIPAIPAAPPPGAPGHPPGWGAPPPGWAPAPGYPPPWPAYAPAPWPPAPWPVVQESNGLAVTSMVTGIVGLAGGLCCVVLGLAAPAAIVTGWLGMQRADQSMGRVGGRGMAQAGLIMGIVGTVLLAFSLVLVGLFALAGI